MDCQGALRAGLKTTALRENTLLKTSYEVRGKLCKLDFWRTHCFKGRNSCSVCLDTILGKNKSWLESFR